MSKEVNIFATGVVRHVFYATKFTKMDMTFLLQDHFKNGVYRPQV